MKLFFIIFSLLCLLVSFKQAEGDFANEKSVVVVKSPYTDKIKRLDSEQSKLLEMSRYSLDINDEIGKLRKLNKQYFDKRMNEIRMNRKPFKQPSFFDVLAIKWKEVLTKWMIINCILMFFYGLYSFLHKIKGGRAL
jgi:hypothetical protein